MTVKSIIEIEPDEEKQAWLLEINGADIEWLSTEQVLEAVRVHMLVTMQIAKGDLAEEVQE